MEPEEEPLEEDYWSDKVPSRYTCRLNDEWGDDEWSS